MKPIVLCLALIRWAEAIRKRNAPITGRRLQSFFDSIRMNVISTGGATNRKARRSAKGLTSDHKEAIAAMRSTPRAFKRSA